MLGDSKSSESETVAGPQAAAIGAASKANAWGPGSEFLSQFDGLMSTLSSHAELSASRTSAEPYLSHTCDDTYEPTTVPTVLLTRGSSSGAGGSAEASFSRQEFNQIMGSVKLRAQVRV